jgi:hypothetical protein
MGFGCLTQTLPAFGGAVLLNLHSKPLIVGMFFGIAVTVWTELMIEAEVEAEADTVSVTTSSTFSCSV